MPRNITVGSEVYAHQPIILLELETGVLGTWYSDRPVSNPDIAPYILNHTEYTCDQDTAAAADAGQMTFTIQDHNQYFEGVLATTRIERLPARVYVAYGTGTAQLLFEGTVRDTTWNEAERQVTLTVCNTTRNHPVLPVFKAGTSDVHNFAGYDKDIPIVFGRKSKVKMVRTKALPTSSVKHELTLFHDSTYIEQPYRQFKKKWLGDPGTLIPSSDRSADAKAIMFKAASKLRALTGYNVSTGESTLLDSTITLVDPEEFVKAGISGSCAIEIEGCIFRGTLTGGVFTVTEANAPKFESLTIGSRPSGDIDAKNPNVFWLADTPLQNAINICDHYIRFSYSSNDATRKYLPQNDESDPTKYYEDRRIIRQEGRKCWLNQKPSYQAVYATATKPPAPDRTTLQDYLDNSHGTIHSVRWVHPSGLKDPTLEVKLRDAMQGFDFNDPRFKLADQDTVGACAALADLLEQLASIRSMFWSCRAGAKVRLWEPDPITNPQFQEVYVLNGVASEAVKGIFVRDPENQDNWLCIPPQWFTGNLAKSVTIDSTPYTLTVANFIFPLYRFRTDYDVNDVYASLESSIEDNAAKQIDYLLTTYTSRTSDFTSYTASVTKQNNYPANWVLTNQEDVFTLVKQIAWEARIGLALTLDEVQYFDLTDNTDSAISSLGLSTTETGTVKLGFGTDEALVTRFIVSWQRNTTDALPKRFVLEENVQKYGVYPQEINFRIFDSEATIRNNLKFWLHRKANIWRTASAGGYQMLINALPFEKITLALGFAGLDWVGARVRRSTLKIAEASIALDLWLPILSGGSSLDADAYGPSISSRPTDIPYDLEIEPPTATMESPEKAKTSLHEFGQKLNYLAQSNQIIGRVTKQGIEKFNPMRLEMALLPHHPIHEPGIGGSGPYDPASEFKVNGLLLSFYMDIKVGDFVKVVMLDGVFHITDKFKKTELGEIIGVDDSYPDATLRYTVRTLRKFSNETGTTKWENGGLTKATSTSDPDSGYLMIRAVNLGEIDPGDPTLGTYDATITSACLQPGTIVEFMPDADYDFVIKAIMPMGNWQIVSSTLQEGKELAWAYTVKPVFIDRPTLSGAYTVLDVPGGLTYNAVNMAELNNPSTIPTTDTVIPSTGGLKIPKPFASSTATGTVLPIPDGFIVEGKFASPGRDEDGAQTSIRFVEFSKPNAVLYECE